MIFHSWDHSVSFSQTLTSALKQSKGLERGKQCASTSRGPLKRCAPQVTKDVEVGSGLSHIFFPIILWLTLQIKRLNHVLLNFAHPVSYTCAAFSHPRCLRCFGACCWHFVCEECHLGIEICGRIILLPSTKSKGRWWLDRPAAANQID